MAHADAHEHDDHGHAVEDGDDLPHHGPVIEEPRSPSWLPFLGLAFFGLVLVWWLSTPNDAEEARAAAAASASASASAAPAESAPPPQPAAVPTPVPQPRPANLPPGVLPPGAMPPGAVPPGGLPAHPNPKILK